MTAKECSVQTCGRRAYGRGLCNMHYQRWRRHDDPLSSKRVRYMACASLAEKLAAYSDRSGGTESCWPWLAATQRHGYGKVSDPERKRDVAAHRASWELVNGPIPDGMEICHSCDNPPCINPAHLFLCSHSENMADMRSKGRSGRTSLPGSQNPIAKLNECEVADILSALAAGERGSSIARRYRVSHTSICDIASGRSWKHVSRLDLKGLP